MEKQAIRHGATVVRGGALYHYATFKYDHVDDTYEVLVPGPASEETLNVVGLDLAAIAGES